MAAKMRFSDDDLTWLDIIKVVHETEKAKLYELAGGDEQWIPKSVIEDEGDDLVGVKTWWAKKNDLAG